MKKCIQAFLPLFLLISISVSGALAQSAPDSAKIQDIRKMLILTGSAKIGIQVMRQMIQYQRQANPSIPAEFWDDFMRSVNPNELIELIVPIYDRHLSHEDIKAIIAFHNSPAGKKLIAAQPQIARDSMQVGGQWGRSLAQKIAQKMREKGYK